MDDHEDTFPGEDDQSMSNHPYDWLYLSHRTFRSKRYEGRLCVEYVNAETAEVAALFLPVQIESQRGSKRKYETGKRGKFFPIDRGRFQAFWFKHIGMPPRGRWAECHKFFAARMKERKFRLITEPATSRTGTFLKVIEVHSIPVTSGDKLVTERRQAGDKLVTERRQEPVTSNPDKPLLHKALRQIPAPVGSHPLSTHPSPPSTCTPVDACPSLKAMRASQPEGWGWWGYILPDGSRGSIRGPWPDEQSAMAALEEMFNQTATMIIPFPGTLPHVHSSPENDGTGRVMI